MYANESKQVQLPLLEVLGAADVVLGGASC